MKRPIPETHLDLYKKISEANKELLRIAFEAGIEYAEGFHGVTHPRPPDFEIWYYNYEDTIQRECHYE